MYPVVRATPLIQIGNESEESSGLEKSIRGPGKTQLYCCVSLRKIHSHLYDFMVKIIGHTFMLD